MSSFVLLPPASRSPRPWNTSILENEMTTPQKWRKTDPDTAGRHAGTDPPLNYLNLRVNQLLCCLSLLLGVFLH